MPKFKVSFQRTYTITEGFDRMIEAPSRDEAVAAAVRLCDGFDEDCPDDCGEVENGFTELGDFEVKRSGQLDDTNDLVTVDYRVLPDGQTVPVGEDGSDGA